MNSRKPYQGMINESEMMSLIENINKTPNVEWEEYVIEGESVSYPMWKTAIAQEGDTYEDFLDYFKESKNKSKIDEVIIEDDENVGVVDADMEPLNEGVSIGLFGGMNIVDKINQLMKQDKSGSVKAFSENMPNKKTAPVIDNDQYAPSKPDVEIAKKASTPSVGGVKATDAFQAQTKVDLKGTAPTKGGDSVLSDKTGSVTVKTGDMPKGTTTKTVNNDVSTPNKVEIEKAAKAATPTVGMIKPNDAFSAQSFKDIIKFK